MSRGMVVIVLWLLAVSSGGCIDSAQPASTSSTGMFGPRTPPIALVPSPWADEVVPPPPADITTNPPLLTDHATLVYTHSGGASLTIHIRRGEVLDALGRKSSGYGVEVAPAGDEDRRLQPLPWAMRFGLDDCLTPTWSQDLRSDGRPQVDFPPANLGPYGWLPSFINIPRVPVDTLAESEQSEQALQGTQDYEAYYAAQTEFAFGDASLYAVRGSGWVQTVWGVPSVQDNETVIGNSGNWGYPDVPLGHVPPWLALGGKVPVSARFNLTGLVNDGQPLPACPAFSAPPTYTGTRLQLTDRATAEDPPFPYSMNLVLKRIAADPSLLATQIFLGAHPDAYIMYWSYQDQGTAADPRFTGYWVFMFAAPGENEAVQAYCLGAGARAGVVAPTTCFDGPSELYLDEGAPDVSFANAKIADYAWMIDMYGDVAGGHLCMFQASLYGAAYSSQDPVAVTLSCAANGPVLRFSATGASISMIEDFLPAIFTDLFRQ